MLSAIRKRLAKGLAIVIAIFLLLAFGLGDGIVDFSIFGNRGAVSVGDRTISTNELLAEFNRAMVNQRLQSEEPFTRMDAVAAGLPGQIINAVTTRAAIEQETERFGLAMPRELVREILSSDPRFQNPRTGRFDRTVLEQILQQYGFSVRGFEQVIRSELARNQLVDSLAGAAFAPSSFTTPLLMRAIERRTLSYVTISDDIAGAVDDPTPEALRQFYDENPGFFTKPAFRRFRVIDLSFEQFSEGLTVSEEDVKKIYDLQRERIYEKPELRSFYQLRFDTEAEAQGAKAVLDEGKPIEEFAAEKGISLDTVTFTDTTRADILDPTVAEAAFNAALESDSVSDPVQGIFGWTVIVMTAITPPETQEFDDVKEEIRAQYLEQDVQRRIYDAIEAIEDARDTGADLVAAAEETGARVTAFGPVDAFSFEPGGAIVDEIPGAVLREAFTVGEGEESEVVEYDDDSGSFYVVVDEVIPSALSPFDDVAAEVEPRWREAERDRRIGDVVRSLKEKVSGGASFESAAQSIGAEITEITLTRGETNETFTTRLNEDLFIASTDEIVDGDAAESDVAVVAQLTGIDFDRTELNPALERSFKRNFGFQYDQEIIDAYLSDIRDEYGVRIDRAKIDQLFSEGG